MIPTRALTDKEIEQTEVYSTIYLTPDSHKWDPNDESYKINEDLFLDCIVTWLFLRLLPTMT